MRERDLRNLHHPPAQSQGSGILLVLVVITIIAVVGGGVMALFKNRNREILLDAGRRERDRIATYYRQIAKNPAAWQLTLDNNAALKACAYDIYFQGGTGIATVCAGGAFDLYGPDGTVVVPALGGLMFDRDLNVTTDTNLARWKLTYRWKKDAGKPVVRELRVAFYDREGGGARSVEKAAPISDPVRSCYPVDKVFTQLGATQHYYSYPTCEAGYELTSVTGFIWHDHSPDSYDTPTFCHYTDNGSGNNWTLPGTVAGMRLPDNSNFPNATCYAICCASDM